MSEEDRPGKIEPPLAGTLLGSLDRQRATFAWKAGGLDVEALSAVTMGNLLQHLAGVEDTYFAWRLRNQDPGAPWPAVDGQVGSLHRMLIDLIDEYARHVGHADLIREPVDGLVGEDPPDGPL